MSVDRDLLWLRGQLGEDMPSPWHEAELMAAPCKPRDLKGPRVLVRRRVGELVGSRGEDLVVLPGHPAISLFTGCGAMDLGIEMAGFCVLVQHELTEPACATLIANRPRAFRHAALIQGDIRETPTSMLLGEAGLRVGEAMIVTGGPPCQGFSRANAAAGRGEYDERNDLVYEFLRVVDEAKPRHFLFENVPGFVWFNGHEYLEAFLERAYGAYYELVYGLMDCVEYGVPQYRCRFICMGTRRDVAGIEGVLASLPAPTHFGDRDLARLKAKRAGLLFPECDQVAYDLKRAPGIRYFPDRDVLIPPEPLVHDGIGQARRSKSFMEFYRRLEQDEPDRLVTRPLERE